MKIDQILLNEFLLGAIVLSCGVAGLYFLRFWRKTRDRLFVLFAIAFWVLGANWMLLAFINQDEVRTWLYVIRLCAFLVILYAILEKNRAGREDRPG
jgi:Ca2+/Na+ antiporter